MRWPVPLEQALRVRFDRVQRPVDEPMLWNSRREFHTTTVTLGKPFTVGVNVGRMSADGDAENDQRYLVKMNPEGATFGPVLRQSRADRGWSLADLAKAVNYSRAYISEVERGLKRPSEQFARRCEKALGLGGLLVACAEADRLDTASVDVLPQADPRSLLEFVMNTAHESTSGSARDGSRTAHGHSVDQARDTVRQLALGYNTSTPIDTLAAARRLRDDVRDLAERTVKPGQISDLYQVAGQACGIMSVASFDLAIWPAAIEQARAAAVYADLVDDRTLQAWSIGTMAYLSTWFEHPREATKLAAHGVSISPGGTAKIRLLNIAARAWAHLGDAENVQAAIQAADTERETLGDTGADVLHDQIGGEFGFGPARQAMCQASAWLKVGDAARASNAARTAIHLRTSDSTGGQVDLKAATDLANADLLGDDLDAAAEALAPVWDVPSGHRNHSLVSRLTSVADRLSAFGDAQQARDLAGQISAYAQDSAPRALPPSSDPLA